MKIRTGFVSNSSSSSFICDICGHTETGFDQSLSDLDFVQCVNEHTFCNEHLLNDNISDDEEYYPEDSCPICQFIEYSQPEMARYLLKKYSIDRSIVFDEIKKVNRRRKKLYDTEYIEYVFKQFNLTDDIVLKELKERFGTYSNFLEGM